ncbi:MAG: acetyl-CoA carboxylase biotin carboxyl carrier protein [Alphaproteobacteria bacterium]|nr:acetyl-CoA carboxylase biotin carboxyl carrier protein [Alphaproteobacteria bacterium]MBV9693831.1 acetyl-CoA carboxylase biotin carboxyl carrier protein [Alphaproteobacteria bacterium]
MKSLGARFGNGEKAKAGIDADAVRELALLLTETGLTEIEIEHNGARIRVARQATTSIVHAPTAPSGAATAPVSTEAQTAAVKGPHPGAVPSPMVGTVYVAPEPGKPPFVKVGDSVKEGDTLLIVEAMKTMNPITAPRAGKVLEICINDAQPVEFGQTLLVIA